MKTWIAAATTILTLFTFGAAQADTVTPLVATRPVKIGAQITATDAKLIEFEQRIKQTEEKITALQTENAALKEQLNNQKTSIKAIDMVLTDVKQNYANHVHYLGQFHISGFLTTQFPGYGAPVKVLITNGSSSSQFSGKPEAAK